MFYSSEILGKKGIFASIWLAGIRGSKKSLRPRDVLYLDIRKLAEDVQNPPEALSLRVNAVLMFGLCIVHREKALLFWREAESYYSSVDKAKVVSIDMPKGKRTHNIDIKHFDTNVERRLDEWTATFSEMDMLLDMDTLRGIHTLRDDELTLFESQTRRATRPLFTHMEDRRIEYGSEDDDRESTTFGKPSFGAEIGGAIEFETFEDDSRVEDTLPPQSFADEDRCVPTDSLNTIRTDDDATKRATPTKKRPHDDGSSTSSESDVHSITPHKQKRIRLCKKDRNTKLTVQRPDPGIFVRKLKRARHAALETTRSPLYRHPPERTRGERGDGAWFPIPSYAFDGATYVGAAPDLLNIWKLRQHPHVKSALFGERTTATTTSDVEHDDDLASVERLRGDNDEDDSRRPVSAFSSEDEDRDGVDIDGRFSIFEAYDDEPLLRQDGPEHLMEDVRSYGTLGGRPSSIGRISDAMSISIEGDESVLSATRLDAAAIAMLLFLKRSGLDGSELNVCITLRDCLDAILYDRRQHRSVAISNNGVCRSDKHFAACAFSQMLVLKMRGVVDVHQESHDMGAFYDAPEHREMNPIEISEGPKLKHALRSIAAVC